MYADEFLSIVGLRIFIKKALQQHFQKMASAPHGGKKTSLSASTIDQSAIYTYCRPLWPNVKVSSGNDRKKNTDLQPIS